MVDFYTIVCHRNLHTTPLCHEYMKRRAFLSSAGTTVLAGCNAASESTSSETSETTAIGDPIEISVNQPEWIDNRQAVSVILANESEDHTAAIEVTVQWFDEQSRYIGQDSNSILSLKSDATWYAEIGSTAPFEAKHYNISAIGYRIDDRVVSGIEKRTVDVDSDSLTVTGEIDNKSDAKKSLYAIISTYDNSWLTHSGSVNVDNIPAENVWRFQTQLRQVSHDESEVGGNIQLTVLDRSQRPDVVDDTVK